MFIISQLANSGWRWEQCREMKAKSLPCIVPSDSRPRTSPHFLSYTHILWCLNSKSHLRDMYKNNWPDSQCLIMIHRYLSSIRRGHCTCCWWLARHHMLRYTHAFWLAKKANKHERKKKEKRLTPNSPNKTKQNNSSFTQKRVWTDEDNNYSPLYRF